MKILILVIIVSWSFSSPYPNPKAQIVSSENEAAILVWNNERAKSGVEPNQYDYRLYEVDFESSSVKQINIPDVTFIKISEMGK